MDLIDRLIEYDKALMLNINSKWHNPLLDLIFQHIRETYCWMPMYLFLFALAAFNFGKRGWLWIVAALLTLALSDQVSSNLIKNNIIRLRPCRDSSIADQVRFFIRYCPGSSSFTSSHACNHFAFAGFVVFTLRNFTGPWIYLTFFFAFAVSYAQVYVGVHYPIDVICGGLTGALIGYGMSAIFNKKIGLPSLSVS